MEVVDIGTIIPVLVGSFYCILSSVAAVKFLHPFILTKANNIDNIFINTMELFSGDISDKYWVYTSIVIVVTALAISIYLISNLIDYLLYEELVHSSYIKIMIILWISLLVMNGLLLAYHLLFIILAIIVLIIILIAIISGSAQRGGGPVRVRGYIRNGSWVRSHTRRRPRRY